MGEPGLIAEQRRDLLADRIELRCGDTAHGAAALTREELSFAAPDQHVEAGTVAEVHVPGETVLLERLEIAVHRGDVEAETSFKLLGRDGSVRLEQRLEDESARGGEPQASLA